MKGRSNQSGVYGKSGFASGLKQGGKMVADLYS